MKQILSVKIRVEKIPEEGLVVGIGPDDEWVRKSLPMALATENPILSTVEGKLQLTRTDEIVSIQGTAALDLKPSCDRCGEPFVLPHSVSFSLDLAPRREFVTEMGTKGREIELRGEDLEFGFYDEDEIDLEKIVGEQLVLGLPLRLLCRADCRGLCPRCGTNLNEATCSCRGGEAVDLRWEALKSFKPKK